MVYPKYIVLLLGFVLGIAGQFHGQNSDCSDLLVLTDTIHHSKPISGYGNVREFDGNDLENKKAFEREENSIWYLITVPDSGYFTFDIITQNKSDDWDFLLFERKSKFCKRIEVNKIAPIRTNLSRSPITGLSRSAKESYVSAGINNNYSKAVLAKKRQQFVLVVNNPKNAGRSHTLKLHFPKKPRPKVQISKAESFDVPLTLVHLTFKDAIKKEMLSSNVTISGLRSKTIELDTVTDYEVQVSRKTRRVFINVSAPGYMLTSSEYSMNKSQATFTKVFYLKPIQPGTKVNLKRIQFYGNKASFLPSARSALAALLTFMKHNPTVKVEIEGHVNGPGQRNTNDYKTLSYNRANAVRDYLIQNDIEAGRIQSVGYGNSQMLYPDPKTEIQQSANRRVEIKIISK